MQKMKANKTMRVWEASKYSRRKDKQSESNIDSIAYSQILKKKKTTTKCQESPHTYQY
jgi:hypothetical protein